MDPVETMGSPIEAALAPTSPLASMSRRTSRNSGGPQGASISSGGPQAKSNSSGGPRGAGGASASPSGPRGAGGSPGGPRGSGDCVVLRGLLWVQQDRLFSRWKERFVVLTTHYLQLFKRGRDRLSEMGPFLYKVRLSSLVSISLEERRGSLTLVLGLREGRLVMRRTEGIREWQGASRDSQEAGWTDLRVSGPN